MELKDTIPFMISTDYKQRFQAEYMQLCIRLRKLERFIVLCENDENVTHDCPVDLLRRQAATMIQLKILLEQRAEVYEDIELEEV